MMSVGRNAVRWYLASDAPRSGTALAYCFGPAGAGGSPWLRLMKSVGPELEARAIRLGGRESRFGDEPCRTVPELIDDVGVRIADEIRDESRPVVLVGTCAGAVLAAALVASLPELEQAVSLLVVVGQGYPAPPSTRARDWSSEELREVLVREEATPRKILDDPSTFELFEPTLRADFELAEAAGEHVRMLGRRTATATLALRPADDRRLTHEQLAHWELFSTRFRGVEELRGGPHPLTGYGHEDLAVRLTAAVRREVATLHGA